MVALARAHAELRAAQIENERLREQIKGRDAHITELKNTLASRVDEFDRMRSDLQTKETELSALQEKLKGAVVGTEGDDLKRIRGIGPGFERTLKQHGITTYAQLAAWTGDDILRIAALLNTQPGRVVRGAWIEQAAALLTAVERPTGTHP